MRHDPFSEPDPFGEPSWIRTTVTAFRVDPPKTNSEIAPRARAALLAAAATAAGCANNLLVLLNRQQHEAHPTDPSIQEIIGSARALVVELTIAAREDLTQA